jgi:hypothetical protein
MANLGTPCSFSGECEPELLEPLLTEDREFVELPLFLFPPTGSGDLDCRSLSSRHPFNFFPKEQNLVNIHH